MSLWIWIMLLAVIAGLVAGLDQPHQDRGTTLGGDRASRTRSSGGTLDSASADVDN